MNKILIIRLSSIGDIILTTPLVRAVRDKYPNAQIDFLVKHQFKSLMEHNPHLSNLITFDKSKDDIKLLKKSVKQSSYDWIIDIHKNFRSHFLTRNVGAGLVTRYNKQIFKRQLLVWFGINRFGKAKPVIERYFEALTSKDIIYDGKGTEVFVSKRDSEEIEVLLKSIDDKNNGGMIAVCPGASFSNKRWLPAEFAKVADQLSRNQQATIVLLGGPEDVELCDQIKSRMEVVAYNYAGKLSLLGSAAMLSKSDLAITNDSGLMHLAQSQGTSVVAVFGPTTKELGYFPIPKKSKVLQVDIDCRPCTHNGLDKCPKGHFNCMNKITSDMVLDSAQVLLSQES